MFTSKLIADGCLAAAAAFALVAVLVMASRYGWERRRQLLRQLERWLLEHAGWASDRAMLAETPLTTLQRLVTEPSIAPAARRSVAEELLRRLGVSRVVATAGIAGSGRGGDWQRIWALRILAHAESPEFWSIVEPALAEGSPEVVGSTSTLLGQIPDRRAAALLGRALAMGRFTRSRVATALETFPLDIPEIIRPLLVAADPRVRYWSTLLMRRYPMEPGLGEELAALARTDDAFVRKAALTTLAFVGGASATAAARDRLTDPAPFVRGQAARTLGALGSVEAAGDIAPLLADKNWWVRFAAKQSLEALGSDVAPALIPWLSQDDRFARNSAAEVLQNIGLFEKLVREETTSPRDPSRVTLLGLFTRAGGVRASGCGTTSFRSLRTTPRRGRVRSSESSRGRHERPHAHAITWTRRRSPFSSSVCVSRTSPASSPR